MSARDGFALTGLISRRKLLSAKANLLVMAGFTLLLALFWIKGAFLFSFRLFLFLFPHLFLFLAQDMFRDEVDSGALENILFLRGGYRSYLRRKNAVIAAAAAAAASLLFAAFSLYGLATHQFGARFCLQFGTGVLAGFYYLALAGLLSFFFRAGTNVLLVILGQVLALFGLLLAAAQRPEWIERLTSASFPGLAAKFEFLAFALVLPNIIIPRGFWFSILGLGVASGLLFGLQMLKIRSLELRK